MATFEIRNGKGDRGFVLNSDFSIFEFVSRFDIRISDFA